MKKHLIIPVLIVATVLSANAQTGKVFTTIDYERATKMLSFNTNKLVYRNNVNPTWLDDGRVWYSVSVAGGREYVLINPADGSRKTGPDLKSILPDAPANATPAPGGRRGGANEIASPDGKKVAFIKEWNLWVRDVASKQETQLTTDGIKDFGYATDNAGWKKSDRPILLWSPDSKKIATFQQDQRHVSDMYLVSTNVGAPKLEAWKYPLPVDKISSAFIV